MNHLIDFQKILEDKKHYFQMMIIKYLDMHDYRELVQLQNEYQDAVFGTNSSEYETLKRLSTKRSTNKKSRFFF